MHQSIDIIKPDFILISGTLFNVNNICSITHGHSTGTCIVFTNSDAFVEGAGQLLPVGMTDVWNAIVALRAAE